MKKTKRWKKCKKGVEKLLMKYSCNLVDGSDMGRVWVVQDKEEWG